MNEYSALFLWLHISQYIAVMFKNTLAFSAILACYFSSAQQLKQAPWQQKVDYNIQVSLDDSLHVLRAYEVMSYHNQSPQVLNEIYIHLWPNAYLNNETPFAKQQVENGKTDFYYAEKEDRGRLDSLNFKVNGQGVKWEFVNNQYEICKLVLNKPLAPGEKIEISTPFRVKLPKVFSRLGHEGQMYCITQWYPKPAVYDVNGWNAMPYLDQGEFYSEFGSFDVSITVPANYIVAATGNLQNADEMEKLKSMSDKRFPASSTCHEEAPPASSAQTKTLRYTENNIHDFAWFADKRFKVERSEVTLANGHKVSTWLFDVCPKKSAVHFVDTGIIFYSQLVGNYPYNHATAVVTPLKAGAGMEYPTITNVDDPGRQVIVHEVGHNWFYGMLGSNERMYPWMDESINNYYESRSNYTSKVAHHDNLFAKRGDKKGGISLESIANSSFGLLELQYLLSARANTDQKAFLPSEAYTDFNYGTIIYGKASLAFLQLQNYLGDAQFDAMMKSYFEKWKYKHPLPDDFKEHAQSFTGKNLDWFFKGLMDTEKDPDYAITHLKREGNKLLVSLKNKGKVTAPVSVQTLSNDVLIDEIRLEPFEKDTVISVNYNSATHVRLDAREESIDVWRKNNYAKTKGLFKTSRPIQFKPFFNLEKPQKQQVFYSPIIGANLYNKTMLGAAFYNSLFPRVKTEYILAPMYSFGTKDLAGYASLQRRFLGNGAVREMQVGIDAARFAMYGDNPAYFYDSSSASYIEGVDLDNKMRVYEKLAPRVSFLFRNANPRTDADKMLTFRYVMVHEQKHTSALFNNFKDHFGYVDVQYSHRQNRAINPYSVFINYQYANAESNFQKITAEFNTFIDYGEKKKGLTVRAFAGIFLQKPAEGKDERAQFRAAENNGYFADYLFDHSQFGRGNTETMFSQQIMPNTSGFRTYAQGLGNTDSWVASANFTSTIPGVLPIRPFVDVMIINSRSTVLTTTGSTTSVETLYEANLHYLAGVSVWVFKDVLQVNFPIYADKKTTDIWDALHNAYGQRITFTLKLNALNPVKQIREMKFL